MTAPTFSVEEIGWLAHAALSAAQNGLVVAPLTRSFYIKTNLNAWVCIGPETLGAGPLNVCCRVGTGAFAGRPARGAVVRFEEDAFFVEGAGRFVHVQAHLWTPPVPPAWTYSSLRLGVGALDKLAKPPAEGLGSLGFDLAGRSVQGRVERAAVEAARMFERAVVNITKNGTARNLDSVDKLLGRGPGLTPSGDDYLAGTMVALQLLGASKVRDTIWNTIRQLAPALTSPLSFAHLQGAAAGALSEPIHLLLHSVLANEADRLPARLAAVGAIGHTSGWDVLAGAMRMFRVWLEWTAAVPQSEATGVSASG
jgi:hypothetical protein